MHGALLRHPAGLIGVAVLTVMVGGALAADLIAPYDPLKISLSDRLFAPMTASASGDFHLLGTDAVGRDLLSRILHGARISLAVGTLAVVVAAPLGILLGLLAGHFRGWADTVVTKLIDIQLAIPFIIFAVAVMAVVGPSIVTVVLVIGVVNWVVYARVARGQVIELARREFVVAARSTGCSEWRIMFRHILPNMWSPLIVVASFQLAQAILLESSLTFLGAGIPPPAPTWGGMLSAGREHLAQAWWVATIPGLALAITVLGINFTGDFLRDVLDPTEKRGALPSAES